MRCDARTENGRIDAGTPRPKKWRRELSTPSDDVRRVLMSVAAGIARLPPSSERAPNSERASLAARPAPRRIRTLSATCRTSCPRTRRDTCDNCRRADRSSNRSPSLTARRTLPARRDSRVRAGQRKNKCRTSVDKCRTHVPCVLDNVASVEALRSAKLDNSSDRAYHHQRSSSRGSCR